MQYEFCQLRKMAKETSNTSYKHNVEFEVKEEWHTPELWQYVQYAIANFKAFNYRDDDVIICAYPRSGTHMTWLLVRYLLQGNTEPIKDTFEDSHLPPMRLDNAQTGRRVFNSHYLPANFGDDFFKSNKQKFIYVSRNPKDVTVSLHNVMQPIRKTMPYIPEKWGEFLPYVLTTDIPHLSWMKHRRGWEEFLEKNPDAPVLELIFEEIVRDPETAIKKMAKFLEVPLSDQFLKDMLVASKFEKMKDAPKSEDLEKLMGPEAKNIKYYKKGKIGDWVNTFTVAQNELFDAEYKKQMEGSKVKNIYE